MSTQTERSLQAWEARHRRVFDAVHEGIWFIDHEARTTYVNRRMSDMIGYTPEEMLGHHFSDFAFPEDRLALEENFRLREQGVNGQYDFRYRHKSGAEVWALICSTPLHDDNGAFEGVLGMHTDITARKKAETHLAQLAMLVEASGDAIASLAPDGRILTWNAAAESLMGYTAAEMIGRSAEAMTPSNYRSKRAEVMARVLAGETVHGCETVRVRKDGQPLDLGLTLYPVRDTSGRIHCVAVIARDVTRRKREQAALRHAQKMEAVGRLAGGIAHDFNNMLAVILGQVGLLTRQHVDAERLDRSLESIRTAAEQARYLVGHLLALSQKQVLSRQNVDVSALVKAIQEMLLHIVGDRIRIDFDLQDGCCVQADPTALQQVVVNIVLNARDAMADGGVLRITTHTRELEAAEAEADNLPRQVVVLALEDTGCGITDEVRAHLFEPFYTTRPHGQRSGLGLATSEGIVCQTGGRIFVESTVGQGSIFRVVLPHCAGVHRDPEPVAESRRTCKEAPRALTILLVDDDALVRQTAAQMLSNCGHRVLEATSAEEALCLASAADRSIDLLMTDVRMPGLNGPALAEALTKGCPSLPVVFMSACADDARVSGSVAGAQAWFLQKPFTVEALASTLETALHGAARRRFDDAVAGG